MHNEREAEGRRSRRGDILSSRKEERWKDGQRRCPKGRRTHSAWLPIRHHGNCVCIRVCALVTNSELEGVRVFHREGWGDV